MGVMYASVADLEARWRPLDPGEKARAEVLLRDASVRVRAAFPTVDERVGAQTLDPDIPLIVVCEMVKRAMLAPVDQAPMTQIQQTAGPFSQGGTFTNPTGDLYMTKGERRLLGAGAARAFSIDTAPTAGLSSYPGGAW